LTHKRMSLDQRVKVKVEGHHRRRTSTLQSWTLKKVVDFICNFCSTGFTALGKEISTRLHSS